MPKVKSPSGKIGYTRSPKEKRIPYKLGKRQYRDGTIK